MGSQNSKFVSQQELPPEYRPLKQLPGVYQSILNGSRIEKHKLELQNQTEINYQKDIFIFRKLNSDILITAHFFEKTDPQHFCNLTHQVCFFTEYPSYIMSYDLVLSLQQGLTLLIQCLRGFQLLFIKFGPFSIGCNNIFFNNQHQPKLWISSDLGKTRVDDKLPTNLNEQKMISDLFKIFGEIKDEKNSSIVFLSYLKKYQQQTQKDITFKNVIAYMVEEASKIFMRNTQNCSQNNIFLETKTASTQTQSTINHPNQSHQNIKNYKIKSNRTNTISLKAKNNSKNSKHTKNINQQFCPPIFSPINKIEKSNNFKVDHWKQKQKKVKRYNTEQDCPHPQLSTFKEDLQNCHGQGIKTVVNNQSTYAIKQNSLVNKERATVKQSREIRKQKNQMEHYLQHQQFQTKKQQKMKRNRNRNRNFANEINTIQRNSLKQTIQPESSPPKAIKIKQNTKTQLKSLTPNSFTHNSNLLSPMKDNDNNYLSSNLQTLKSIINSEYSIFD